ncbi:MAG: glycosyltransferase [Syntrophomonadaceae bacterium]|nr:UDP-N-acetylglucosamine--LPS N-acetylglucosamine transferase [Syntrophomonadaceae bacterium]MDH7498508.1 glycosyltransferase [Syntrophomonadaceae bacterium]
MDNLRVLIFSASFGAGHVRAAEAVIEALRQQVPGAAVTHLDCGELLGPTFNTVVKKVYIETIKHTPRLWGEFYYRTSRIRPDSLLQRFLNNWGRRQFLAYIEETSPDLIVCTYPTVAGVLARLRRLGQLHVPLVTIVTDYTVHSQWIHRGTDLYLVGCEEVARGLVARGIDPSTIRATGIPVSPRFEQPVEHAAVLQRLGLQEGTPVLLVMGGAYGVLQDIRRLIWRFANGDFPLQVIVVCGRDRRLYDSLDFSASPPRNRVVRLGFVDYVHELMSVSDLMVTKAGGLIVSEALTKRLPMIIFRPIPGQEEMNAAFVERAGAGRTVHGLGELVDTVYELLRSPRQLEAMREGAARAVPREAAANAVRAMLELLSPSRQRRSG